MPLGDRPRDQGDSYIRVTKLSNRWFIPKDYIGTLTEQSRDGEEYTTYLFKIYLVDDDHLIEFRATRRFYQQFNAFLTSKLEKEFEEDKKMMRFESSGMGRDIVYHFKEEIYATKVPGKTNVRQVR